MENFFIIIAVWALRLIYAPLKLLPTRKKITFISKQENYISIDFDMLSNCLREKYPLFQIKILTKKLELGVANKVLYGKHLLLQLFHIATSRVVIIDGYCIAVSVLNHKADTKVVQIWHALGAIKKFGHQAIGKPSGHSKRKAEILCMHKNYDYVLCASQATAPFFCEAFKVNCDKLIPYALPRLECFSSELGLDIEKIEQYYPQLKKKKNILYAPTFRKGKSVNIQQLAKALDLDRYNLIVKLHPLDHGSLQRSEQVTMDRQFSTYEWARYCDCIITDYSSLAIEASVLDKPLYFFLYDVVAYEKDPGINVNLEKEAIKDYVFQNAEDLVRDLDGKYDYHKLRSFREKYLQINPHSSYTEDLAERIVQIAENE